MTSSGSANSSAQEWTTFITRCVQSRITSDKFKIFAISMIKRSRLPGSKLCDVILKAQPKNVSSVDALVPQYFDKLLGLEQIDVPDILSALYQNSRYHGIETTDGHDPTSNGRDGHFNSIALEESIFRLLARTFANGRRPHTVSETIKSLKMVSQWISAMVMENNNIAVIHDLAGAVQEITSEVLMLREAFGLLLLSLVQNIKVVGVLDNALPKEIKQELSRSLTPFIQLLAASSVQIASELDLFQKSHPVLEISRENVFDGQAEDEIGIANLHLGSVMDLNPSNSRASLFIYLQAMLVGRPLTNDASVLSYLQARFKGDIQTTAIDLITAAFDSVNSAIYRTEPSNTTFLLRSFIANKLPLLLTALLASSFNPLSIALCAEQAFARTDPQSFQTFSQPFNVGPDGDRFSTVRQEFISACVVHGLMTADEATGLHAETTARTSKTVKRDLVAQYNSDPKRLEAMIARMQAMDGNAGSVALAVTQILHNLCASKDTLALKAVCLCISKKPQAMDALSLFVEPATLLQPLCNLLDEWRYDEDQGEYQPAYDEFGAVTLFVMAFVHRFGLCSQDLALNDASGFVAQYVDRTLTSQALDSLSSEQQKHLTGWIRGLFETEGISDDLMSACRPQDFYLLVPTLFNQFYAACAMKKLSSEALKNGLELLLETFLMPSLIGAFTWLSNSFWEAHSNSGILMQIVQKLVKPASLHGEAVQMHNVILSIVGKPLEQSLQELRRLEPSRSDIDPLLEKISPTLTLQRVGYSLHEELQSWTVMHNGGLLSGIRSIIQSMVMWSLGASMPAYTHRQILVSVSVLGAMSVLRAVVDEVKAQTETSSGSLAVDVATALICAPTGYERANAQSENEFNSTLYSKPRLDLREALQIELEEAAKISLTDALRAETLVRLGRKVEAQSTHIASADLQLPVPDIIQNIELSSADGLGSASATAPMDAQLVFMGADDSLHIDTSGTGLDFESAAQNMDSSNVITSGEDDIFAGLGLDADMDFS